MNIQICIQIRAWIETHFGWVKSVAKIRQVKQRGLARVEALFQMAMAASNVVRLPRLLEQPGAGVSACTGNVRPLFGETGEMSWKALQKPIDVAEAALVKSNIAQP